MKIRCTILALTLCSACKNDSKEAVKPQSSSVTDENTEAPKDAPNTEPSHSPLQVALADPNVVILDVRTSGEFASSRVKGAVNVPVAELESRIAEVVPDKNTQIVVHCASGGRSASATEVMTKMGYTKIFDAKTPDAVAEAKNEELVE